MLLNIIKGVIKMGTKKNEGNTTHRPTDEEVDSYLREYSKKHNITQDYIIEAVIGVRYKTKIKKGD